MAKQAAFDFDPEPQPVQLSYRQALIEQIKRDMDTLSDPEYFMEDDPLGEDFYLDRVVAYREEVKRLDK